MAKQVRIRRGTTAQHATFTGADGEVTYDTSKKALVVHDGVTAGGKPVDEWVKLNPGGALVIQTIDGRITLSGGDADNYCLGVANESQIVSFATVTCTILQLESFQFLWEDIAYAASVTINFATGKVWRNLDLTGNVSFVGAGHFRGGYRLIKILADASARSLTFPASWKFIGAAVPANIAANKTALLQLFCFDGVEAGVVARYEVEP